MNKLTIKLKIYISILVLLLMAGGISCSEYYKNSTMQSSSRFPKNYSNENKIAFILEPSKDKFFTIYGETKKIYSKNKKKVDLFEIEDGQTHKKIDLHFIEPKNQEYSFYLPSTAIIEIKRTFFTITYLRPLPCGKNWKFKDVPVLKQIIEYRNNKLVISSNEQIYDCIDINEIKVREIMDDYKKLLIRYKKQPYLDMHLIEDELPDLISKLFLCAINDYHETEDIFLNLEKIFPKWIDGLVADYYYDLYGLYNYEEQTPK